MAAAHSGLLTALGPIENDPGGEIVGELFEPVYDPCRHKKGFPGFEVTTLLSDDKLAVTGLDDIDLVLRVWFLGVSAAGLVEADLE